MSQCGVLPQADIGNILLHLSRLTVFNTSLTVITAAADQFKTVSLLLVYSPIFQPVQPFHATLVKIQVCLSSAGSIMCLLLAVLFRKVGHPTFLNFNQLLQV